MAESVFLKTEEFLSGIEALYRLADEEAVVERFRKLLLQDGSCVSNSFDSCDLVASTLTAILDRVAYFPLRPSDMQVIGSKI